MLVPFSGSEVAGARKSEVKWLEAAVVGTPVIATPTQPYRSVIDVGCDGWLAGDETGWAEGIAEALARGAVVGRAARARALGTFGPDQAAQAWSVAIDAAVPRTGLDVDMSLLPVVERTARIDIGGMGRRIARPDLCLLLGSWRNSA